MVCLLNNIEQHHIIGRLSDEATVFMAELKSIETAIEYAISSHFSQVKIISDSRSVLQAVQNINNDYPPIRKIKALIAHSDTRFELIWTRSHIGVVGNEIADSYAKEATTKEDVDFHLNTTINFIKKAAHKAIIAEWQQQWSNSMKGRPVHELCPLVNTKRLHGNHFINQIITGHGAIAIHQHKFFGATSVCNCGAQMEDRTHIVFNCELWRDIRKKFFPKNYKDNSLLQLMTNIKVRTGLELIMKKKLENLLETMN
ncbi:uncharacterized protein CDAR_452981 [Caerostris darwini]|uniref:RNase H type-1 domain-containing protein n=1 Tax=Caerostris darwini TaxID=1538125 RepID=A0AAV4VD65_9ARAC|nr:uncharacterized protein CDAR_452981 [Caerostris darwini]